MKSTAVPVSSITTPGFEPGTSLRRTEESPSIQVCVYTSRRIIDSRSQISDCCSDEIYTASIYLMNTLWFVGSAASY
jgi:hypothetical protein